MLTSMFVAALALAPLGVAFAPQHLSPRPRARAVAAPTTRLHVAEGLADVAETAAAAVDVGVDFWSNALDHAVNTALLALVGLVGANVAAVRRAGGGPRLVENPFGLDNECELCGGSGACACPSCAGRGFQMTSAGDGSVMCGACAGLGDAPCPACAAPAPRRRLPASAAYEDARPSYDADDRRPPAPRRETGARPPDSRRARRAPPDDYEEDGEERW